MYLAMGMQYLSSADQMQSLLKSVAHHLRTDRDSELQILQFIIPKA